MKIGETFIPGSNQYIYAIILYEYPHISSTNRLYNNPYLYVKILNEKDNLIDQGRHYVDTSRKICLVPLDILLFILY